MRDQVARTEPTGDQRTAASEAWGLFVAFGQAGFTEQQALQLIGVMLAQAVATPRQPDGS